MSKFGTKTSGLLGSRRLAFGVLACVSLCTGLLRAAPANDNFANAFVITNGFGSTNVNNKGATAQTGEPTHGGFKANSSVWFQWRAPANGAVTFDTLDSYFTQAGIPFYQDTVLAVYTGSTLGTLTQIAANDDQSPIAMVKAGSVYPLAGGNVNSVFPIGPSELQFNAVSNTLYYIAVDTKPGYGGNLKLNWAYNSSGMFRWATEDFDPVTLLPLFVCASGEANADDPSTFGSYFQYGVPGVLATVTRVGGSAGRVLVDYGTQDGLGTTNAVAGTDYLTTSGTLVFDDNEMTKSVLIPILPEAPPFPTGPTPPPPLRGLSHDFYIYLTNPRLDPYENAELLPQPRIDPLMSNSIVRVQSLYAPPANQPTGGYDPNLFYNYTVNPPTPPSHDYFNFERVHYTCARDTATVTVWVMRFPNPDNTGQDSATINYQVNNIVPYAPPDEELNNQFALTPDSDYAIPTPPQAAGLLAPNYSDFVLAAGSVSIPFGTGEAPITFTVPNNKLTEFAKDFHISLWRNVDGVVTLPGVSAEADFRILFDDNSPPAGSVDQYFNPDHVYTFATPVPIYSDPPNNGNPGTDGQVMSILVLTNTFYVTNTVVATNNGVVTTNFTITANSNDETMIGGDFITYDAHRVNRLARVNHGGYIDLSFNAADGPNGFVSAIAPAPNNGYLICGAFTSYRSVLRNGVAMVNLDGSLNGSFTPGFGANGTIRTVLPMSNGRYLIAGDFTSYNLTNSSHIALIHSDGSLDGAFSANLPVFTGQSIYAIAVDSSGKIFVGGAFSAVNGVAAANIACLNSDGTLYTTFGNNISPGADGTVYALAVDSGGRLVLTGAFQNVSDIPLARIARVTSQGIVDPTFNPGIGPDDTVYTLNSLPDGTMYLGGQFLSYNGTRRLGLARIFPDGSLDTSFMDGAYNQFAGLHRFRFAEPVGVILTTGVQSDGNLLIGGAFSQVGGGQTDITIRMDPNNYDLDSTNNLVEDDYTNNIWMETKARNGLRNHANYARIIGGATPGPGNLGLSYTNYNINKSQSYLSVTLNRQNGSLGYASANFSVVPGVAQSGVDYSYYGVPPIYDTIWSSSRQYSDALFGTNTYPLDAWGNYHFKYTLDHVTVNLLRNSTSGDRRAQFQLANPPNADQFLLGGANIPIGLGLAYQGSSSFTVIDDSHSPGTVGFASPVYTVTEGQGVAVINLTRTNGSSGAIAVHYATTSTTSSNTTIGVDYWTTNGTLTFQNGVTNMSFAVPIIQNTVVQPQDRIVGLALSSSTLSEIGLSNAALYIIDDNYPVGYLKFSANGYTNVQSAGSVVATVNRVGSARGVVSVTCSTTNNSTAQPGVDYVGVTTNLTWNTGDSTPRYVVVPILDSGAAGANTALRLVLSNPVGYGTNAPLMIAGSHSTADIGILNDNYFGTLAFSAPNYTVNENGGYATLTVVRSGGVSGTLTVNYATSDGPNTYYQGEGTTPNYITSSGTLVFQPNQVAASFTVPVIDDGVVDPTNGFYFNVTLSSITPSGAILGAVSTATVSLVDVEAINAPSGQADPNFFPVMPGFNGDILSVQAQPNGQVIAGGNFTLASGVSRNHIARVNSDGSLDTGFLTGLSGANAPVNTVLLQADGAILIGGAFTNINNLTRNYVARLLPDGTSDQSFSPGGGADGPVYSLAQYFVAGGTQPWLLVGGNFSYFNGFLHSSLVRLYTNGSIDATFTAAANPGSTIYAIATYPQGTLFAGDILIGGNFTTVNGVARNGIARLNPDGSLDTTFDPGAGSTNAVRTIALQLDGRILLGGSFTYFDGAPFNHLVRLNPDGSIDNTFNVGVGMDDTVNALALQQDARIVAVGAFAHANGVHRNRITRLLSDGTVDPSINFGLGADGNIDAVAIEANGYLAIGGAFTNYDGSSRSHLAQVFGGSMVGSGSLTFLTPNFVADENQTNALISVRRIGGTAGSVGISFSTSNGSGTNAAIAGVNFSNVTTTLNFATGETLQSVLVPVMQDFQITPDLVAKLTLEEPFGGASLGDQYLATLTIYNDDSSVSFSAPTYAFRQNVPSGSALIQLSRLGSSRVVSTVDCFTTTNGSALLGTDYLALSNRFIFAAGSTNVNVFVPLLNNPAMLNDATVDLRLTNAVNTLAFNPTEALLTILTTNASPGQFFLPQTNFVVREDLGVLPITVVRTNGHAGAVNVNFSTVQGTSASSAVPGVNYVATNGVLAYADGELSKTLYVTLLDPQQVGPNTTFTVALSNPTAGATLLGNPNAAVTLMNIYQGIGFRNAVYVTNETAGAVVLTVDRLLTNGTTTVQYLTSDGTAQAGINYLGSSGTLTFPPNVGTESLSIPVLHDPRVTGSLSFSVSLVNPSDSTVLYPNASALVNLLDSDAGISLSTNFYGVLKSGTNVVVSVLRSNANTGVVSVNFATTNGTAITGQDYYQTNGTLIFSNGIALQSFSIPIINNHAIEGNRSFQVLLSTNQITLGTPQLLPPTSAMVTITDNVSGLSFSSPAYQVGEKGGYAVISVVRSGYTNCAMTVDFSTSTGTNANSAVAGVNYYPTNGTLLFTNGQMAQSFAVPVIDDNRIDGDHLLEVILANPILTNSPVGFVVLTTPNAATLTISEADGSEIIAAGTALTFTRSYTNGTTVGIGSPNGGNSSINVTNLSSQVEKVVVRVPSATTPLRQDLALMLAGPTGTAVGLAANAGSTVLNHTALAFDDWAALALPQNGPITNGTYKPGVYGNLPSFGLANPPAYTTNLGSFNDSLPGGTWTLYAADAAAPYLGALDSGWSVDLTCLETNPGRLVQPGETVTMLFAFRDAAGFGVTNLVATLVATNGVANPSGPQAYGPLVPNGPSTSRLFTFTAAGTNGQIISPMFQLTDGARTLNSVVFNLLLGAPSVTFSNSARIVINDNATATPYPSQIAVSGVGSVVTKVTATLTNLAHTYPRDLDILLVSPAGQASYLMAKAGGSYSVTNLTITFDDTASSLLPNGQITNGVYRPTSYAAATPPFPPTNTPAGPYATNMTTFAGYDPNGVWSLYVLDDTPLNSGIISNGWSLTLTTASPLPSDADLSVGVSASAPSVILTSNLTFWVTVVNNGPGVATNVLVANTFPAGAALTAAPPVGRISTNAAGQLVWNAGTLLKGAQVTMPVTISPAVTGQATWSAVVSTLTPDLNPSDDSASASVNVVNPTAVLVLGLSSMPNLVPLGNNFSLVATVTNLGPATATGVSLSLLLDHSLKLVSATPGAGSLVNGILTYANLGDVGSNGVVTATLLLQPTATGVMNTYGTCSSGIPDPAKALSDNSVKTLIVGPLQLQAQSFGNNLVLSWPAAEGLYNLQMATNLVPPVSWVTLTNAPVLNEGTYSYTNGLGSGPSFFRLVGPTH